MFVIIMYIISVILSCTFLYVTTYNKATILQAVISTLHYQLIMCTLEVKSRNNTFKQFTTNVCQETCNTASCSIHECCVLSFQYNY